MDDLTLEQHLTYKEEKDDDKDALESLIEDKPDDDTDEIPEVITIEEDDDKPLSEEEKIYQERIKRIKKRISLEGKVERKINVDHNVVEEKITAVLDRYNLTTRINEYILSELYKIQNKPETVQLLLKKNNAPEGMYKDELIFTASLFEKIDAFVKTTIRAALEQVKAEPEYRESEIYRTIIDSIDTHIELTLSDTGIDKLTLVSYHYFISNLEKVAKEFILEHKEELPNMNKQKTATSLYHDEVSHVLSNSPQMKAFTATIVSITTSWLEKYRQKSAKLGQFITDLTLSTNDVMVDRISRYILLIALKNKNPIVLRSIFSTFLSLIHRNIASLMSVSLTNVKVGYFRAMAHMFEDEENTKVLKNRHMMLLNVMVKTLKKKNRRRYKENHYLQKIFAQFIEPNKVDFVNFATGDFSPLDEFQMYVLYGRYIKNCDDTKANSLKLNQKVRTPKANNAIKKYLDLKVKQNVLGKVYGFYKDEEAAEYIIARLKTNISRELDPMCYITSTDVVNNDVHTMYDEIDQFTSIIGELIEPERREDCENHQL